MTPRLLYGYIIQEFLKIFAASVAGFLLVCLIGDAAERLSKFIDCQAPARLILLFYLNQIPYYLIYILPASSLIATLFTLGQMGRHNELTAMLSSGISLLRIFLPLFVLLLFVSAVSFTIDETIVPQANQRKSDIMDYQIQNRPRPSREIRKAVDYQGEGSRRWVAESFNLNTASMNDVKLIQFSGPPESPRIDYRIDAAGACYVPDSGWSFKAGTLRYFKDEPSGEWAVRFDRLLLPQLTERPADFVIEVKEAQQMNYTELKEAIERKRRNGIKTTRDEVEFWYKTALPASNFIIVIFGAPLAVMRRRIGPGIGIAMGIVLYILFMGSSYITKSMGYNGVINPLAAAWASNLVFALCGVLIFFRVRN
ncbi:MAG TPA: LptF/LptG family permease [archaeon]|nr:LptF/LptG family permease [archaeon]